MTEVICKYELEIKEKQTIAMPSTPRILSIQEQGGKIVMWARVNIHAQKRNVLFSMYGTGHTLPQDPGEYVSSVQAGPFVWHIFKG